VGVFLAPESWPFVTALLLLLLISAVEGASLLFGTTASHWVDSLLPDPWDGVDGPLDSALGWLHVGKVPVLVLTVIFLAAFTFTGFALNMVVHRFIGLWVPALISIPVAFVTALPVVRILGAGLARVIPKDQTFATTLDSLVGRVATIVTGEAKRAYPAQAKVSNEHGQTIYVMVEPDSDGTVFVQGDKVLLVQQLSGSRFAAIANPRPDIL
jgi:hypothetical protein